MQSRLHLSYTSDNVRLEAEVLQFRSYLLRSSTYFSTYRNFGNSVFRRIEADFPNRIFWMRASLLWDAEILAERMKNHSVPRTPQDFHDFHDFDVAAVSTKCQTRVLSFQKKKRHAHQEKEK